MSDRLMFVQHNDDSDIVTFRHTVSGATVPLNLTGVSSAKLDIVDNGTIIDTLDLGDGLQVVSATGGTVRVAMTPARTAVAGKFNWRATFEWTNGDGPLTWPLSGCLPILEIFAAPAVGTQTTSRVYYGVGIAGLTSVATLQYDDTHSSLYLTTPALAPTAQKAYVSYPVAWGPAEIYVDGLRQTGAFTSTTITVGAASYYLYESTDLLTTTGLELELQP